MSKVYYYLIGSYIYCYGEATYRAAHHEKLVMNSQLFHCTTFPSAAYTLSFVIFSPIVLPFHFMYFGYKYSVQNKN